MQENALPSLLNGVLGSASRKYYMPGITSLPFHTVVDHVNSVAECFLNSQHYTDEPWKNY
jgi:hypothetical protein